MHDIHYIRWTIVVLFILSAIYVHYRGKVRHGFARQASDHSTFLAPINVLMYLFSKVPNQPYLDKTYFPEMKLLEDNWQAIKQEAVAMHEMNQIKNSSNYDDAGFNSFFKTGWKRFYLKWYNVNHPSAMTLCPVTTQLLNQIPSVKAAMFAELPAGSRLVRHRDPYAGSVRYHLGLVTPNSPDCHIVVDGELYSWKDGESVVFDETYIHYAENKTNQNRIILFCDLERPMKYRWAAKLNHWIGKYLMSAASAPNQEGDKTGGINKAFKYAYMVRRLGKEIKSKNRTVYYILKWALIGGLIAAFLFI